MANVWVVCFSSERYEATITVSTDNQSSAEDIAQKFLTDYLTKENISYASDM